MGQFWNPAGAQEKYYYALNDPDKKRFPHTAAGWKAAQEYEAQLAVEQFKKTDTAVAQAKESGAEFEGPLPDPTQFAKGTQLGQTEAGAAFRGEQEMEKVKEGVSQFADKYEDKDQMYADYLRMGVNIGLFEKEDIVKLMSARTTQQAGGGFGKSSVGAALAFTQSEEGKAMADKVKKVIGSLREQGIYSSELLDNLENMTGTDVRKANEQITGILGATEKTVRTLGESKDIKVQTAKETKEASTEAGILTEAGLAGTKAKTEAIVSGAKSEASTIGSRTGEYKLAAGGMYDLSGTEAKDLANAADAIDAMNWMQAQIDNKNVSFLDLTPAGKIKNPEAFQKFQIINEYYARPLSGAAINEKEWKQFRSEVLTKSYLLTEAGQKAAAKRLRGLINKNITGGKLLTKDPKWYEKIQSYETGGGEDVEETTIENLRTKYKY